jgi:hypothetical protein
MNTNEHECKQAGAFPSGTGAQAKFALVLILGGLFILFLFFMAVFAGPEKVFVLVATVLGLGLAVEWIRRRVSS